ncbi:MAG: 16S rRNA (guanine(527)-N(7))-methyltransferase RsmG [Pseudomonadales bacterium]|nr:16S rRNA (guanine(527)-N(7))-methyltransferase RsmG [Pseudomonadales bacterium]
MNKQYRNLLQQGVQQLSLQLDESQIDQLLRFGDLIVKWNKTHNLTAITDPSGVVSKHLLDSLSISSSFPEGSALDVGSGAGLPGIPLAIVNPQQEFTLIDSSLKRIAFIREAKRELALTNITAIHSRVEDFKGESFAVITSRAFSSLGTMLQQTQHLLADGGCWFAMKGVVPTEEINEIASAFKVQKTNKLLVPGLDAERHIIQIGLVD